jgi:hypothetical protein
MRYAIRSFEDKYTLCTSDDYRFISQTLRLMHAAGQAAGLELVDMKHNECLAIVFDDSREIEYSRTSIISSK